MTKAQRILELYAKGDKSDPTLTRRIAEQVGCRIEYVRVVALQRRGRGVSEIESRYLSSSLGRATVKKYHAERYATDPEFRRKKTEISKRWMESNRDIYNARKREQYARKSEQRA